MLLSTSTKAKLITQTELKQSFKYDEVKGGLVRIVEAGGRKVGDRFGCPMGNYIYGKLQGRHYLEHILVYLYMTGEHPEETIDHIDGNGLNNLWENLRKASFTENMMNAKLRKDNPTGIKGISFRYQGSKKIFRARISKNGRQEVKSMSLIVGRTEESIMAELITWVENKRLNLHGEYANSGKGYASYTSCGLLAVE